MEPLTGLIRLTDGTVLDLLKTMDVTEEHAGLNSLRGFVWEGIDFAAYRRHAPGHASDCECRGCGGGMG